MTSSRPTSKRKQTTRPLSNLLHPGEWRAKRARFGSGSESSTDSGASTPVSSHSHDIFEISLNSVNASPTGDDYDRSSTPSSSTGDDTPPTPQISTQGLPDRAPDSPLTKKTGGTSWVGLEKALRALHISTKVCPPLHAAVDSFKSCLNVFEEAAKPREDYEELAIGLKAMVELLDRHLPDAACKGISDTIVNIAEKITREIKSFNKRQSQARTGRLFEGIDDEYDLIRRYRKIEQLFRQLQGETSLNSWNVASKHLIDTQLEKLRPVKLACFDSELSMDIGRRSCTENTRVKILTDSMEWADNPAGAKIYWMNGMAGTGKTTIAYNFCEKLAATGQLVASFFCTRTSQECREAKRIVPTIAYQIARRSAPFRHALCGALDEDPDVGSRIAATQFELLLTRPSRKAIGNMANNLVVVIDALDECSDPHVVELILGILFRFAKDLPVKFFITSRPEPIIRSCMMSGIAESDRLHSILYLHEIEKSLVQADIELYLEDELKNTLSDHHADIEELAEQAGNLFIYAATAVRYIRPSGKVVNSKQRLRTILDVSNQSNKGLNDIDVLYSAILTAAIQDETLDSEERRNIQAVLWTVICACEPMLIDTIGALSGLEKRDQVVYALEPLRSVLHVSEHSNLVTTLHASFPDYMFSRDRSKQFFCDKPSHNQLLATSCLDIMKSQLHFNICQIQSSFIFDDDIPDLPERANANISPELFYACRYWVEHLSQAEIAGTLVPTVEEFLSYRLLFWMEVLNIRKYMVTGAVASTMVNMWLRNVHAPSELITLAHDAQTFVGNYAARPVSLSTPHIYLSALPLSSPISQIRLKYHPRFKGLIRTGGTFMEQIDEACLAVWYTTSPIVSVSFSTDRRHIVSGDKDGYITLREPHSGKQIHRFKAHRKLISSVAFSSDAALIVSSSHDHTICTWDSSNRSLSSGPFRGHTSQVNSAVFSPDDLRLVSGADDCTIRIWTTSGSSECLLMLAGHISPVKSVAFSPNGANVVSGSNDHTVCIWDALNGVLLHSLRGHTQTVTCVRFSPSGDFVVSGSNDSTIRIWDAYSGSSAGNPLQGHTGCITSIAVSPEGERIASGSLDRTIRVWHRNSGELMAGPFEGHSDSVRSVGFSTDGARIISASDDKTIRVWNSQGIAGYETKNSPTTETSRTVATAISPNGAYVASGHEDRSIKVWDFRITSPKVMWTLPPITTGHIFLLEFSPDSAYLFTMSSGAVLHVLDVQAGECIAAPQRFSLHPEIAPRPLATSSDGRISISTQKSTPAPIIDLWNLQSDQLVRTIKPMDNKHEHQIADAVVSSNSTRLATATRNGIINVWDGTSGLHIAGPFHFDGGSELTGMGISPDGMLVASAYRDIRDFVVYNATNGSHTILSTPFHRPRFCANHLRFSPNAEYLFLACREESSHDWFLGLYSLADPSMCGDRLVKRTTLPSRFRLASSSVNFVTNDSCLISASTDTEIIVRQLGADGCNNTLDGNGWILNKDNQKMIWVPPEVRDRFPVANESILAEHSLLTVNYDHILVGDEWSQCYIGE